ncbi:hypothetical protein KM043_003576 [Ampulex compressa]|nr:hypothetical protein KM043_003576 [Ampulex compressa]
MEQDTMRQASLPPGASLHTSPLPPRGARRFVIRAKGTKDDDGNDAWRRYWPRPKHLWRLEEPCVRIAASRQPALRLSDHAISGRTWISKAKDKPWGKPADYLSIPGPRLAQSGALTGRESGKDATHLALNARGYEDVGAKCVWCMFEAMSLGSQNISSGRVVLVSRPSRSRGLRFARVHWPAN